MAGAMLMILMVFLLGSLLLILSFAYQSKEEERAASANAEGHLRALDGPRFFANLGPALAADPATTAPAVLVQQLEDHVRREQQVAAEFLHEPSLDRLFPGVAGFVDNVAKELERHLQHENAVVSAFMADPSVEGLLRDIVLPAPQGTRSAPFGGRAVSALGPA